MLCVAWERAERHTLDSKVVGLSLTAGQTLLRIATFSTGVLFTPMCHCHQAIIRSVGERATAGDVLQVEGYLGA